VATTETRITVSVVGWRAAAALARAGGPAHVLAVLSASRYVTLGGEICWLGPSGAALHPRALLTSDPVPGGDRLRLVARAASGWRARPLAPGPGVAARLRAGARSLRDHARALGGPEGFGPLLTGGRLAFPLEGAGPAVLALSRACGAGDADGALAAALPLLGLGPGLTPAGDDLVGGAFFARAVLARLEGGGEGWRRAAEAIRGRAAACTHPISAALLGDLLDGESHAPLHDLAAALVAGGGAPAAETACARLARLGHSSGWDLLAGFAAGLGALG
jgi:hypothetical protein